ncbi:hypothetical protein ACJX0J_010090, partial [Zea mays]
MILDNIILFGTFEKFLAIIYSFYYYLSVIGTHYNILYSKTIEAAARPQCRLLLLHLLSCAAAVLLL